MRPLDVSSTKFSIGDGASFSLPVTQVRKSTLNPCCSASTCHAAGAEGRGCPLFLSINRNPNTATIVSESFNIREPRFLSAGGPENLPGKATKRLSGCTKAESHDIEGCTKLTKVTGLC